MLCLGISLQRRIVNRTARRCLCGIASLMIFWFVIRTLKYDVFYEPVLRRYSWYCYYIPLLSIPSLSVIAALKMRESENQKRRQWTGIFLVITVGVILLVMTNDLHQLVFLLPAENHGQMMSIFMVRDLCFVWHGSLSVFLLCWAY